MKSIQQSDTIKGAFTESNIAFIECFKSKIARVIFKLVSQQLSFLWIYCANG